MRLLGTCVRRRDRWRQTDSAASAPGQYCYQVRTLRGDVSSDHRDGSDLVSLDVEPIGQCNLACRDCLSDSAQSFRRARL